MQVRGESGISPRLQGPPGASIFATCPPMLTEPKDQTPLCPVPQPWTASPVRYWLGLATRVYLKRGLTPKRELPQHFPVYFGAFVVAGAPYRLLTRAARQKDLAAHGSLPRSDLLSISSHINQLLEAVPSFVGLESTRGDRAVHSSLGRCLV
jgi:hypothetical protein